MPAKTKIKKVSKIKNIKDIKQELERESKNPFPDPIKSFCFNCKEEFWIKFVIPQQSYSSKNFLSYWTEQKEDREKCICSPCLRKIYSDSNQRKEFLGVVKDAKKKVCLRSYYSRNII